MTQIDAMTLQEMLKKENTVSIGWLQKKLELSYTEAQQMASYLQKRGWLAEGSAGGFKVVKAALFLRFLEKREVGSVVDTFTNDCQDVLNQLQTDPAEGADFATLEKAVQGEKDTQAALEILIKHKFIYQNNGFYFLRVNKKTVTACKEMTALKWLMERRGTKDRKRLIACFDDLFA